MPNHYKTLATLGDPPINQLTSSYYVAQKRGFAEQILAFASFEEAVEAVWTGAVEVALVAGAYPKIRDFIMDEGLICIEAFVEQIPPLVVCGMQESAPENVETVYLHPATIPLLPELAVCYVASVETKATSAAAARATDDAQSVAICNQLAADYYGLRVHQILRPALNMPFALFQRAS